MAKPRIHEPGFPGAGEEHALSPAAFQHAVVVLRMRVGETLVLFDGEDREAEATLVTVARRNAVVRMGAPKMLSRESPCRIHLGQALSKGDRFDWVVQKAVELGVSRITPLITQHTVVRLDAQRLTKKCEQWQAIAVAACEQSGRNRVPVVEPVQRFEDFVAIETSASRFILHPESGARARDFATSSTDACLLVGPEGGFGEAEVELARTHGFRALQLGPRILRTETAAIVALSVLQALAGDL
ncbi:16S rRNA (uracil(1498)-N(3))-methyltransferase [Legionella geestiana]|nr:16S rRNA (uracil(1498)-N(3))-methyltransferase [Legionella geestiana]QBS12245.1 16S rRNA (uracil(1498)-N(3))-methyltransferase [Legionella geestiana]QDQ40043.1 16S rRNA (uracil(1498)-N(3))-methyltransferase [Legionella geestiana]STX53022.1 16S rRNA methyltransferase [Legionella geestiana]